ncbi:MAG: LysR family transcriptional regulator [Elusimicrobiota bacterium]
MLPLNFNHLYYFWVTAKEGSLSAACRQLFLSQSTLSIQIQKLEQSLKVTLFIRGRHGVTLTHPGKLAFERCERMFAFMDSFAPLLRANKPFPFPALNLGVTGAISYEILGRVVKFLRKQVPSQSVRVFFGGAEDLQERLARHSVDVLLADVDFSPGLGPDYRGRLVAGLPFHFVASPALIAGDKKFPDNLNRIPLFLRTPENSIRKEVDHFLYKNSVSPGVKAEAEDINYIILQVRLGAGAAALDELTMKDDLRQRRLVKLHRGELGRQNIFLINRRHHRDDPAVQKAMDILMETFTLD